MTSGIKTDKQPIELRVLAANRRFDTATRRDGVNRTSAERQPAYRTGTASGESAWDGATRAGDETVAQTLQGSLSNLPQTSRKFVKRFLLATSGHIGAGITSVLALGGTLWLGGQSGSFVVEALIGLALIRLIYHLTRGPLPALARHRIRRRLKRVIADETQVSVAFIAACYLMRWPLDYATLTAFIGANLLFQMGVLHYSRTAMRALALDIYAADEATFARRALIVGTGTHAQRVADMVMGSPDLDTKLTGFLDYNRTGLWRYRDVPLIGHPDDVDTIIAGNQVDAVFVAVEPQDILPSRSLFDTAEDMGVCVFVMPNVYYPTVAKIRPSYVNGMPALIYRSVPENRTAVFLKSLSDRLFS
jgi:hypothetical protein